MTKQRPTRSLTVAPQLVQSTPSRWRTHDAAVGRRLRLVGIELTWSPTVVVALSVLLIVVLGWFAAGVFGGFAGVVMATFVSLAVVRVGTQREKKRQDELLPEIALRLSRALRSGQPTEVALESVGRELRDVHSALRVVHGEIQGGRSLMDTLDSWQRRAEGDAEQLLTTALHVGVRGGGELAAALDSVGDGLRDALALDRRRRAVLAQTQLSAGVLVALPVAFAVAASVVHGGLLYDGVSGFALLVTGLTFDIVGVLWMRRLIGRLR